MRKEINEQELESVAGGFYKLNYNTHCVGFTTCKRGFLLKSNVDCSVVQIAMNSLIGKFATPEQYDSECLKLLEENDWIEKELELSN